ncbi:MAG: HAMP domain-containing protein [Raineya sp.]|nr:HAMP domain-containing protein [Raineya sp.]
MAKENLFTRIQSLNLQVKLLIFLGLVLVLSAANYVLVNYEEVNLANSTSGIEVAQRNEVISQKFGFLAFSVFQGNESYKKELEIAINEHQYNLDILENGGTVEILNRRVPVSPVTGKTRSKLNEIKQLWGTYRENLLAVLTQSAEVTQIDSVLSAGQVTYTVRRVPNQARRLAMAFIQDNTISLFTQNSELADLLWEDFYTIKARNNTQITLIFLGYVTLFIFVYWQFSTNVVTPIRKIAKAIRSIAAGDFSVRLHFKQKDELGVLAEDINNLSDSLRKATEFATAIGNHEFNVEIQAKNEQDKLVLALIRMRDSLKNIDEESEKRTWVNTGIALFNDILRKQYPSFEEFAYAITYNMVQYLQINQMGFYSLVGEEGSKKYLKLEACYAYDRRRFENETIDLDDGLLAQAVLEKAVINLTEVPENYIRITSGLGDAPPRNLLIVPLMNQQDIFGVIELASFQKLKDYEIEFVKKVAESTATTIATIRINEKTKRLLEEAQEYAQRMQAQEEEMRQNVEELASTQEILQRREKETAEAYQKLAEEYERKVAEMNAKERMLSEQKSQLQASLDIVQENFRKLEKQYEEVRVALEKLKNKEASMAFAIQEKDKEIITLRKTVEELRKGGSSSG